LPGEVIKKGQVLATIENPEFSQNPARIFGEFEVDFSFLKKNLTARKSWREEDINSGKKRFNRFSS